MNSDRWWGQFRGLFTKAELLVIVLAFGLLGAVLLSLDPDWVLFAGSMSIGVPDLPVRPAPLFDSPLELFQTTDRLLLVGLLGLLLLMGIRGEVSFGWVWRVRAWLKAPSHGRREEANKPEMPAGASPKDIHLHS